MSNTLTLLELLENIKPDGHCDDCLSEELSITPRQKVNQVCRPLHEAGRIVRLKATCSRCGKVKLVNTLVVANDYYKVAPRVDQPVVRKVPAADVDIEKLRTDLVRICRTLWQRSQSVEQPRSISVVINQLRNSGVLPNHQASLMLTLCNLRNVHVYEDLSLGEHEQAIAFHAAAIVGEWWSVESRRGS